ncbi:MAG: flagellar basal body P-ring formation chaperone FlgA [Pseudomonadota bacterium]
MKLPAALALLICAQTSLAETVVAARNLRPGSILLDTDVVQVGGVVPGSYSSTAQVVGLEVKVALYAGRPVMSEQLGPPATIERNQLVEIIYQSAGLSIRTEGRALGRGSEGQRIRVMNLTSKSSLFGTVQSDGSVRVSR